MKKAIRFCIFLGLMGGLMLTYFVYQACKEGKTKEDEKETIKYENVYIHAVSGGTITYCDNDQEKAAIMTGQASATIEEGIADLYLVEDKVTKIVMKKEVVQGKILAVTPENITVQGYGLIPIANHCGWYQKSETVTPSNVNKVIVGYENSKFYVADGKVQGGVMEPVPVTAENPCRIRVLVMDSSDTSYYHHKVELSGTKGLMEAGGLIANPGEVVMVQGEKKIYSSPEGGTIRIRNLNKGGISPTYEGTIEVTKQSQGYTIINELNLEDYLKYVVPSEMPVTFGEEALKTQAICARTYAYSQIQNSNLGQYGAHVDDSVNYQVYNHSVAKDKSNQAVTATASQVLMYKDKPASTYFFSTSCGMSSGTKDVWFTKSSPDYLPTWSQDDQNNEADYSKSNTFYQFLRANSKTYDSESPWYRWRSCIPADTLKATLDKQLQRRYKQNKTQVQTKTSKGFICKKIETLGTLKDIKVAKRGKSGILRAIDFVGSKATIRVYTEYAIRSVLGNTSLVYRRGDGKGQSGMTMLPSGYFCISFKKGNLYLYGGGYGHGVGMSQYGAKAMAKQGKNYQEIINHYFPKTLLASLTSL